MRLHRLEVEGFGPFRSRQTVDFDAFADDGIEVVVEFSASAGRFRVTRSPEYVRPAKRGGGMTKQASAVSLDEWTDAGWIGRAARAVDVATELDDILQLS